MGTLTETKSKEKEQEKSKSPYVLILHNDSINSFDNVIDSLVKYCKHELQQAEQVAHLVHLTGKCDVKRGDKDKVTKAYNNLKSVGLTVTMESI